MILLTRWHDKLALVLVVFLSLWLLTDRSIEYYKDAKHAQYKAMLLKAKDPLTITSTDTKLQVITCGGTVKLPRYTAITKPLSVTVRRTIIRVDSDIVDQEVTHLPDITYTDATVGGRHITYTLKTPTTLPDGMYLYAPTLSYKVNEFLTIEKPAPSQVFRLVRPEGCME